MRPAYALTFKSLVMTYIAATAVAGGVHEFAWSFPSITQAIIAVSFLRLGLLYLVLRRLVADDRWTVMAWCCCSRSGSAFTGFHAGFREPLIMAVLAFLERFDRRNVRHWVSLGVLCAAMAVLGVTWISVRVNYRERYLADEAFAQNRGARFDSITAAARQWAAQDTSQFYGNVDVFIDRLWAIYYPALAVARVPDVVPHTDGKLMLDTLQFVFMPRIFFPDKPEVGSDSELVRRYSGVWVAGANEDTDIAFGYAAESYIDFGVPLMFLPVFIWGTFMGVCYAGMFKYFRHRDIAVSVTTVICWLTLYLFERSWTKTIGLGGTLMIYVGSLSFVLDRLWFEKFRNVYVEELADADEELAGAPPLQFPAALEVNIWNGAAVLYARYRLGLVDADTQTTAAERACLTRHAAGRRSLVEIGVMHGATTALLRSVMAPEGVVTGIDRHPPGKLLVSFERLVAKRELARHPRGQRRAAPRVEPRRGAPLDDAHRFPVHRRRSQLDRPRARLAGLDAASGAGRPRRAARQPSDARPRRARQRAVHARRGPARSAVCRRRRRGQPDRARAQRRPADLPTRLDCRLPTADCRLCESSTSPPTSPRPSATAGRRAASSASARR